MRNVKFKKWIPIQWIQGNSCNQKIPGTAQFSDDYPLEGKFHQWGSNHEEFENGVGNYTVAIIECPDGTIEEVLPSKLKFISKQEIDLKK